ncbi:MAG: hypothetical protein QXG00_06145, partial [Candidatus Woesearchaeota archaeon]
EINLRNLDDTDFIGIDTKYYKIQDTEVIDNNRNIKNINSIGLTPNSNYPNHFIITDGRFKQDNSNITGSIKIKIPPLTASTMLSFWVDVFNYATGTSFSAYIAGYRYISSKNWVNASATIIGNENNLPVYFYYDASNFANAWVYIGTISTIWNYPQIIIRNATVGYSSGVWANLATGWEISIVQSYEGTLGLSLTNTSVLKSGGNIVVNTITQGGNTIIDSSGKVWRAVFN